jgi:hypothetical protein
MRLRFGLALLALAAAATAVLVTIFLVHDALADGDPASDYLISQQVFFPLSVKVSVDRQRELTSLLDDSKRKGFPLKVAVIAKPTDLGAVPSLFGTPQRYASFLGQEDYYFFKSELLVVMPKGYGLYKHSGVPAGDRQAITRLPATRTNDGDALVASATRAVNVLAARHGLTLSSDSALSPASSPWEDRFKIIAGVFVLGALAIGVRTLVRRR